MFTSSLISFEFFHHKKDCDKSLFSHLMLKGLQLRRVESVKHNCKNQVMFTAKPIWQKFGLLRGIWDVNFPWMYLEVNLCGGMLFTIRHVNRFCLSR